MSKQVNYYTNSSFQKVLLVRTTYAPEPIDKVIVTCKSYGDEAKEFYLPRKERIAGFDAERLLVVAQLLREHKIDDLSFNNFNEAFELGYSTAYSEAQASIQASIDKMLRDIRGL